MDFLRDQQHKYPFDELLDHDYDMAHIVEALDDSAARKVMRASIVMPT
jgi:Zn-dependent alcohol dehydrogenase